MEVFHTNEHKGTTFFIWAQGADQWLGDGYYFWQDYEFAEEWAKVRRYPVADIYTVDLDIDFKKDDDVLDTVFNEEDYYGFINRIEKFARIYYNKFSVKPTLVDFNNYIQDNKISLWGNIKAIRFQDTPDNHQKSKKYLLVDKFPYKKRIQIVIFDKEIIFNFAVKKLFTHKK
jgi:hypothetical protein